MVHSFDLPYSPDGSARRIHLYLPDEYEHTDERYPVLYMFDGH
ncbi:MAG: alpha/beta hydrolase, partial [Bacteroidaceae bacterium]|nr:alpha/beta hydrolase [Bacteroidaceae bacterium]